MRKRPAAGNPQDEGGKRVAWGPFLAVLCLKVYPHSSHKQCVPYHGSLTYGQNRQEPDGSLTHGGTDGSLTGASPIVTGPMWRKSPTQGFDGPDLMGPVWSARPSRRQQKALPVRPDGQTT